MWVVRELLRLLERIAAAVAVAVVIAELRTLASGGDRLHTFRLSLIIVGALLLMMAAVGPGSNYDRYLSAVGRYWALRSGVRNASPPTGPVLTSSAVFVLSGAVVIALGMVI
jgi:hypothetical protein